MSFLWVFLGVLDVFLQGYFRTVGFGFLNRGVSFGMAQEIGNIISFVAFGFFVGWYFYEKIKLNKVSRYLLLLAIGGGANIFCRVIWGSVWDYICIPVMPFCFNLSDVLISLGVVSYILGVDGNRSTLRRQRNAGNQ